MRTVATAGHVDHGKTTLVRRLTGMEPDRLAEEKARGLTIDLGFAWTTLSSGVELAFVDVPGHARFIKNMLAGVGCVDACLFIVAATEGWKPQSEEHLRILELVGVARGVVALTKVGAVDAEQRRMVQADTAARVRGTFLEGADLIAVDSITGEGLDALRDALGRLAATPPPIDRGRPRLWVDRVFSVRGSGLVVTGTLVDGALAAGEHLVVVPGGRPVLARELQSLARERAEVLPGARLAINLRGAAREGVV
ncbi:MAG: 50S ribosome-binding GTPase, partial [Actinobacteria bacterium]|nr:50S ribosome-binding GTPase [Actinomycetota bacterium]